MSPSNEPRITDNTANNIVILTLVGKYQYNMDLR